MRGGTNSSGHDDGETDCLPFQVFTEMIFTQAELVLDGSTLNSEFSINFERIH